jgi:RNA polymerase sigma-70 factor, ECF subfamily
LVGCTIQRGQCDNASVDFEKLVAEHKNAVYRQMIRACGNREDAEDVLIEALLKAYRHMEQLRDSSAFRGWLAQIGKRVCWQLKQREALLPLMQLSVLEDEGRQFSGTEDMESAVALRQMKQLLAGAVEQLSPDYREVYQLRDLDQLPGEEVARRLGISLPALKSRLHRARTMVRQYLDEKLVATAGQ